MVVKFFTRQNKDTVFYNYKDVSLRFDGEVWFKPFLVANSNSSNLTGSSVGNRIKTSRNLRFSDFVKPSTGVFMDDDKWYHIISGRYQLVWYILLQNLSGQWNDHLFDVNQTSPSSAFICKEWQGMKRLDELTIFLKRSWL